MKIVQMSVPGAYEVTPEQHADERGSFQEWFRFDLLQAAVGHRLEVKQANCSVSRAGVLRGIHFAAVPPGQAKYVTCLTGSVFDVVIDIRVGSPTFGRWEATTLNDEDRQAVYIAEGIGHAFMALTDNAIVTYLCSQLYAPAREHTVNPLDPAIGIDWPANLNPILSAKDDAAPSLAEAKSSGLLPSYEECVAYYETLRRSSNA